MEWSLRAECLEPRFIFLMIIQRLENITRKLHQSRDWTHFNGIRCRFWNRNDTSVWGQNRGSYSSYLLASNIAKFENVRSSLKGNIESQLKISLFDQHVLEYCVPSALFCSRNNCVKGLHVVELGRARALADSMSCSSVLRKKRSIY